MEKFKELNIDEKILQVIQEEGFEKPTKIQEKAIPIVLEGKDVIVKSATGSGKTLIYASRIVMDTKKGEGVQSLILLPTRELALQVEQELEKYSKYADLNVVLLHGGSDVDAQANKIKNAEIVVGTPGRVMDHLKRDNLNLDKIKTLVFDEADLMITNEYLEQVGEIIESCADERQDMLFSATYSEEIEKLAKTYLKDPVMVSAHSYVDEEKLKQVIYEVDSKHKLSLLVNILKREPFGLVIVFTNRQETTKLIEKTIKKNISGVEVEILHSGLASGKRNRIIEDFKKHNFDILVTTDITGRGLDIEGVTHIINYTIPNDHSKYVHRVGRTARAGNEGKVINLISHQDLEKFAEVLRKHKMKFILKQLPQLEEIKVPQMKK